MTNLFNMLSKFLYIFVLLTCWFFEGFSQEGSAKTIHKIDASLLESYSTQAEAEYIIVLRDKAVFGPHIRKLTKSQKSNHVFKTLKQHAELTQKPIIEFLEKNNVTYQSFYITNAIKIKSEEAILWTLASRTDIQHIVDNKPFYMLDYIEDKSSSLRTVTPEWGLLNIKADSVWEMGIKGEGVVIAGQDTGYDWELGPIKSKYRGYINDTTAAHDFHWHDAIHTRNPFFSDTLINPCGFSSRQPCDDNNHGTHTMGTMVGQDENNTLGVAPGAQWIACRNMDRGYGQPSTYMECFEWFLAPYDYEKATFNPDLAPHIINNSWYCSEGEGCNFSNFYIMENIIYNLKESGIAVVASAGNTGRLGCGSVSGPPAFFEQTFSIGATDINDTIGNFSSIGPVMIDSSFRLKPDVTAPGVGIKSIIRGGQYRTWSGTSMASPHVAGTIALMISANPKIAGHVYIIEDFLRSTARPQKTTWDCEYFNDSLSTVNPVYGHGIINAYEAVKKAQEFISFSADNNNLSSIYIYPNPTYSHLTIRIDDIETPIKSLSLYNHQGQKLVSQNIFQNSFYEILDLQSLTTGMYILEIQTEKGRIMEKIIKIE